MCCFVTPITASFFLFCSFFFLHVCVCVCVCVILECSGKEKRGREKSYNLLDKKCTRSKLVRFPTHVIIAFLTPCLSTSFSQFLFNITCLLYHTRVRKYLL
uniref:Uncharacterized protein n=1 Tax=Trypanosoma vivax (strain Y486) TaxID=1055687 RepID=G0TRV5_TRYVY|nr:hypothetical protein TVY486_0200890 [Trypanosoma vivax Y486]